MGDLSITINILAASLVNIYPATIAVARINSMALSLTKYLREALSMNDTPRTSTTPGHALPLLHFILSSTISFAAPIVITSPGAKT